MTNALCREAKYLQQGWAGSSAATSQVTDASSHPDDAQKSLVNEFLVKQAFQLHVLFRLAAAFSCPPST